VSINGQPVLQNFDIFATAENAMNTAVARSFPATADASGTITIRFVADVDNAQVNGIQVTGTPTVVAQTTASATDGIYTFTHVPPGKNYLVQQQVPSGWQQVNPVGAQLQFSGATTYAAVPQPLSAVSADFDGDGFPDLADLDANGNYAVYRNQGNGT